MVTPIHATLRVLGPGSASLKPQVPPTCRRGNLRQTPVGMTNLFNKLNRRHTHWHSQVLVSAADLGADHFPGNNDLDTAILLSSSGGTVIADRI